MKIFIPSRNLILATTIFLVFIAPIKSQDSPEDFLAAHNEARAAVGVGHLTWDVRVALYATTYANHRRGDCALKNSEGASGEPGPYGENLAWNSGSMSAAEAVEAWVNQKSDYDYNSNTCADPLTNCLSYTQVVWRNSVKLGCAKVSCINDGGTYITCNYDPPGNIVGQWPY
ncbi:pathogenesis-related protein 1-like [Brassica napus]|uniref:pathogenesis-related protein 1-like n=1 Tax=Brassica napus TaxID=3708 RepID=UPI00207B0161|nr:pathogenesis-related protein 1-like [Brassica napus]